MLITGAAGIIGNKLVKELKGTPLYHNDCDLTDWESVKRCPWEDDIIVHCAHYGIYGQDGPRTIERNLAMFNNIRRRWPNSKLIAFGSGAMHDKRFPIVKAEPYAKDVYPEDLYGLSKRLTVDMADVTLIPFGLIADTRFVGMVKRCVQNGEPVPIIQDVLFSWVDIEKIPEWVEWAAKEGKGRFNLCEFDATLTEVAKKYGATKFNYLKKGMGNEYTGATWLR